MLRMVDDQNGNMAEALIFYTPFTAKAVEDVCDILLASPNPPHLFVPYTLADEQVKDRMAVLEKRFDQSAKKSAATLFNIIGAEISWARSGHSRGAESVVSIFSSQKASVADAIQQLEGSHRAQVREIYSQFHKNDFFRDFCYMVITFQNSKILSSGNFPSVASLQERYGRSVTFFPADDILSDWARDPILAADDNGKCFIQGKISGEVLYQTRVHQAGVDLASHPFWNGRYRLVPNDDIELAFLEGGDLRPAGDVLFTGQGIWKENNAAGYSPPHIEGELRRLSGRDRVIVLGRDSPVTFIPHLDMYMDPLDEGAVAVGDMNPVADYLRRAGRFQGKHVRALEQKQPFLDEAAAQLVGEGFTVERIPLYMEFDPGLRKHQDVVIHLRSYANNVRHGSSMLVAGFGVPELDELGAEVYATYGITARHLPSLGTLDDLRNNNPLYATFLSGGVHCLLNVLYRD